MMLKNGLALIVFAGVVAHAQVKISQVYGGGGNSGATLKNDFIELFNAGAADVAIGGWSVQYASSTGTTWQRTDIPASTVLHAGQYFLIQESAGTGGTVSLPTPDVSGTLALSATTGKIALVSSLTTLTGACPIPGNGVVDFIGFGTPNCFEGAGAAPTLTNTTAALRAGNGCTDTDNNAANFASGAPTPRNTASTFNPCVGSTPPTATGAADPTSVVAGNPVTLTATVTPGSSPASTTIAVNCNLSAIGGNNPTALPNTTANQYAATVTVAALTAANTYSLPCTVSDQSRSSNFTISLTVQPPPPVFARIADVNGPGTTSPKAGLGVTVRGVVTALRATTGSTRGFYIQSLAADDDENPNTSEGLLIFTGSANPPACAVVGNVVEISGTVQDFVSSTSPVGSVPLTELSNSFGCSVVSTGATQPAAVTLTSALLNPNGSGTQARKFQGMRVTLPSAVVVGPSLGTLTESTATAVPNGTYFVTFPGLPRPLQGAGILETRRPVDAAATVLSWNGDPQVLRIVTNGLVNGTALELTTGATVSNIAGVMDFNTNQGQYQIYTDAAGAGTPATGTALSAVPVPAPLATDLTIGNANIERFYNDVDDNNGAGAVLTSAAYQGRLNKLSLAIRNVMRTPDILSLEEVEAAQLSAATQLTVVQDIANKVNSDAVAAGQPNPNYNWCMFGTNDPSAIGIAILYKQAKVMPLECVQFGGNTTYAAPDGGQALLNDRPPVELRANVIAAGSDTPLQIRLVANHLRSLSGIDQPGVANGDRVRAKRNEQAKYLARLISGNLSEQTSNWNANDNLVLTGDFNADQLNDGYVDVMGCIAGNPVPANQQYFTAAELAVSVPCTPIPSPALTNLTLLDPANRYSYSFSGVAETLDHVLVNSRILPRVRQIVYARNNVDFPEGSTYRNNFNRPERESDHDMPVLYLTLPVGVNSRTRINATPLLLSRLTGRYNGTITVTNTGDTMLTGPIYVFFNDLPAGVTLPDLPTSGGVPYATINVGEGLAPGATSSPVSVSFADPSNVRIGYTTTRFNGSF